MSTAPSPAGDHAAPITTSQATEDDSTLDLMDRTSYGKAALAKFGAVPVGFHVYSAEWLGDQPSDWNTMRVTGAQFRGKRRVPGTTMSTIVTREEIAACAADAQH